VRQQMTDLDAGLAVGGFGDRARPHWPQPQLWRPRRHRIDFLYEQRFDPEVPIEDVGGAVRDFITGCWPTVWCATAGLS
jgi:hypothetical protein